MSQKFKPRQQKKARNNFPKETIAHAHGGSHSDRRDKTERRNQDWKRTIYQEDR